jgi:hypothetical protein
MMQCRSLPRCTSSPCFRGPVDGTLTERQPMKCIVIVDHYPQIPTNRSGEIDELIISRGSDTSKPSLL